MTRRTPGSRGRMSAAELAEHVSDANAEGHARTGRSLEEANKQGRRFENWLGSLDLTLEDLRQTAPQRQGLPIISAATLAEYVFHNTTVGRGKTLSTKVALAALTAWLRVQGFDTSELQARTTTGDALRRAIEQLCAARDKPATRAQPILANDLDSLLDTVQENPMNWSPLACDAMFSYVTATWAMSLRGGETAYRLTWSMIDIDREQLQLPGGRVFKWQDHPHVLRVPHDHAADEQCGARCPIEVLRRWRTTCIESGIPVGPEAYVFPCIRTYSPDHRYGQLPTVVAKFGNRLFIADYISEYCNAHTDTTTNRVKAENSITNEYVSRWKILRRYAGITLDRSRQNPGTHGLRRGSATQAARNGTPLAIIGQRLRHGSKSPAATGCYIEPELPDSTGLVELPTVSNRTDFEPSLMANPAPKEFHCEIQHQGQRCGRGGHLYLKTIDGNDTLLCRGHYGRLMNGKTTDDLTRPLRTVRRRQP